MKFECLYIQTYGTGQITQSWKKSICFEGLQMP